MSMQSNSSLPVLSCADKLAAQWADFLILVGRVLIGWIFVSSGWGKLMNISGFVATMPRRGLPDFLGYIAPFVEFFSGLFLLAGFATRYTALLLLVFLIIASFSSHAYWKVPPAEVGNQSSHFWKNVAMKGGMLLLFITGAGRFSLDWVLAKKR